MFGDGWHVHCLKAAMADTSVRRVPYDADDSLRNNKEVKNALCFCDIYLAIKNVITLNYDIQQATQTNKQTRKQKTLTKSFKLI